MSSALEPSPAYLPALIDKTSMDLYNGVLAALMALPASFSFPHPISGVRATDLFNLNSLIGAAIEDQVVEALNRSRSVWDPDHNWDECVFERRSQSFPDVRLVRRALAGEEVVLGIELKGWYTLSKERVPSFRYQVAPNACAPMDVLCVVPWYLDNAVSGEAKVLTPWIVQARYAAEWRDYWWTELRTSKDDEIRKGIDYPTNVKPYPSKSEMAHAVPRNDSGGNFGRLPRCRPLMDEFIQETLAEEVLGIALADWVSFIALHTDGADAEIITRELARKLAERQGATSDLKAERALALLKELVDVLGL